MKFQGRTYETNNPTVRDLAHKLKVYVEKGTYSTPRKLQNSIIDELVPDGWPPNTKVLLHATEISVMVGSKCVLGFSLRLSDPLKLEIKVRRCNVDSHQATAGNGMRASSTSSHENAAKALVQKFFGSKYKPVRSASRDKHYHDPNWQSWQQVQVFTIVKS